MSIPRSFHAKNQIRSSLTFCFSCYPFYSQIILFLRFYVCIFFSFWWNHTRSPENFKGGSVSSSGEQLRCAGTNPRRVRPRGYVFGRGLQPSEARLRRAKRGRPAERSEAPPRLRRAKRGRAKVIGRSPLQTKTQKGSPESPGEPLIRINVNNVK